MIALAVSDFDLPRSLLAVGRIEVDYLETGGHFVERTVAQFPSRPLLLHNSVFNWSLAHPTALEEQQIVSRTLAALERTRAPWLSVHLGFSAAEVFFDVHMTARSPALPRAELLANICRNVRALASAISVPLILENLDYCPGGAYEHICEPDFIAAVLNETERRPAAGSGARASQRIAARAADRGAIWGSCRWSGCASCISAARARATACCSTRTRRCWMRITRCSNGCCGVRSHWR